MDQDYSAAPGPTSRLRQNLDRACGLLAAGQLFYVLVFAFNMPWADEWEFVPALCGHQPPAEFFWMQHNEHRLPLPRVAYLALFRLTNDFRTGCAVQVAVQAGLALAAMRWAAALRGRPHWADLFFPLSLLHVGHCENLLMGYEICFAFACLFVMLLARLAMRANDGNRVKTAFLAAVLSAGLCLCGGFGVAFSLPAMLWVLYLLFARRASEGPDRFGDTADTDIPSDPTAPRSRVGRTNPAAPRWRVGLTKLATAAFALFPLVYLHFYFQDYQRPEGHPPFEWANWWEAVQVTTEVVAIGFGIAAGAIWPAVFVGILAVAVRVAVEGGRRWKRERFRVAGWVATALGAAGLALAIGMGRGGFGWEFGLYPRYSILSFPLVGTLFLAATAWGGRGLRWVPRAFALLAIVLFPVNTVYGIAWGVRFYGWLAPVAVTARHGAVADEAIPRYLEGTGQEERARVGVPMLRARGVGPFQP